MSGDAIEVEGTVSQAHPGDLHAIEVTIGGVSRRVLAQRSGAMKHHRIKLVSGDRVRVELSPYDTTRGRITRRLDER